MAKKSSIKSQAICRLLEICEALKTNGAEVRTIKRVLSPFLTEDIKPALHLVIGHEVVIEQDTRGYRSEFPASFKLILDDGNDRYEKADWLVAWLQEQIEADEQLGGLVSKITFDGVYPYVDEIIPGGFILVSYKIEIRRAKAQPDVNY